VIEVERLTKRYGSTVAVDDLTFRVTPGRITGFLGPNGAGKTTTLKAVLGLVRPTSGTTRVLGKPYRERCSRPLAITPGVRAGTTFVCWPRSRRSRGTESRKCSSSSR
jgi:ABC-type multidrug transport system ATPase subunit